MSGVVAAPAGSESMGLIYRIWDACLMGELVGNKVIESAAVEWVMTLERKAGRNPRDARYERGPADIESPPRVIEVKAFGKSNRGFDLWLETRQVQEARSNPRPQLLRVRCRERTAR
jgi:hypothetical protein